MILKTIILKSRAAACMSVYHLFARFLMKRKIDYKIVNKLNHFNVEGWCNLGSYLNVLEKKVRNCLPFGKKSGEFYSKLVKISSHQP